MAKKNGMRFKLKPKFFKAAFDELEPKLKTTVEGMASSVSNYDVDVVMKRDRNGRPVGLMALKHPNGKAIQAKTGVLSKAARSKGAKFHPYGGD